MEISISHHCQSFLVSLLAGAVLSLIYDIFRILHHIQPEQRWLIAAEDVCYLMIFSKITMELALWADRGRLRVYILLGEALGWIICHFSLSQLFFKVGCRILWLLIKIISVVLLPIRGILSLTQRLICFTAKKTVKIFKNIAVPIKFSLKQRVILLYNQIKSVSMSCFKKGS